MNDPWKHRSAGMRCATCMWFAKKNAEAKDERGALGMWFAKKNAEAKDERGALGRCRRHAPTMNGFPVVFSADWCGDHKLDEEKLG